MNEAKKEVYVISYDIIDKDYNLIVQGQLNMYELKDDFKMARRKAYAFLHELQEFISYTDILCNFYVELRSYVPYTVDNNINYSLGRAKRKLLEYSDTKQVVNWFMDKYNCIHLSNGVEELFIQDYEGFYEITGIDTEETSGTFLDIGFFNQEGAYLK